MTRTITDDSCVHRCAECDEEFACGRQPEDCRETRIAVCEGCKAGAALERMRQMHYEFSTGECGL